VAKSKPLQDGPVGSFALHGEVAPTVPPNRRVTSRGPMPPHESSAWLGQHDSTGRGRHLRGGRQREPQGLIAAGQAGGEPGDGRRAGPGR
jgi:hypothetical protein